KREALCFRPPPSANHQGGTDGNLDGAMHSMRNQPETTARRLGFEDLEDRRLLNGGPFIGPRPDAMLAAQLVPGTFERPAFVAPLGFYGNPVSSSDNRSWQGSGLPDRPGSLSYSSGPELAFAPGEPAYQPGGGLPPMPGSTVAYQSRPGLGPGPGGSIYPSGG